MVERAQSDDNAQEFHIRLEDGDFDLRGFEVTRAEFFDTLRRPYVIFQDKKIKFSTSCVRKFGKDNRVEFLVNPIDLRFAVRTAAKDSRHAVVCSRVSDGVYYPKEVFGAAYMETLFQMFRWDTELKYRISGSLFQKDSETVYIFNTDNAEAFIKPHMLLGEGNIGIGAGDAKPLSVSGHRLRAVPQTWTTSFGTEYYMHQYLHPPTEAQGTDDWRIRTEGRLFETGKRLRITGYDELKRFISQELSGSALEGLING